ncbi:MAG TPA: hypothetical protein VN154_10800, partial [Rhizomicrobium sp.]|nr:hypothetical protein [Rhizomicrobium sp.]
MNKRALMLTAASAALLSGHAYAATCDSTSTAGNCDINTAITTPLYTGTPPASGVTNPQGGLGNITLNTGSSLTLSTAPPTGPALTINSSNTVTNTTLISYQGVNDAVGVLLEEASVPATASSTGTAENFTGEYYSSSGVINLLGTGTAKNGILIAGGAFPTAGATTDAGIGSYANSGLGVFTGVTGFQPSGGATPVAIDIAAGSEVEVQGTNSFGINLIGPTITSGTPSGGASLIGDIDVGGSVVMTPTTLGSATGGQQNTAIFIGGWLQSPSNLTAANPAFAGTSAATCACAMVGNINILQGGVVSSEGQDAQGIIVQGAINGAIVNAGTIATTGTSAQSTALNAADPEGGIALGISNNVSGGIFNSGLNLSLGGAAAPIGTISMVGNAAALTISPAANNELSGSQLLLPVTIGGYTDAEGFQYSLLNRGTISSTSEDDNVSNTAVLIAGAPSATVTLQKGIFNAGTISATGATNTDGPTSSSGLQVTAVEIGNFVTLQTGSGGTGATAYTFVNSSETGKGIISATVSGAESGTATAILITAPSSGATPASVTSLFNSGKIEASATTTNLLLTGTASNPGIAAIAIEDSSGSLQRIDNYGSIIATATQIDDNTQSAVAIDVSSNTTSSVTINDLATPSNSAVIQGDIHTGTLPLTLNITGVNSSETASVTGNIVFNNGSVTDDQVNVGNNASFTGQIQEAQHRSVDISVANTGLFTLLTTQPTNVNSTVPVTVTPNAPLSVGTLTVATGGNATISLSQGNNINAFTAQNNVTVMRAQTVSIGGNGINPTLSLVFGSFVGSPSAAGTPAQFVLISTPGSGTFNIFPAELTLLTNTFDTSINSNATKSTPGGVPFLFNSSICTFNVPGATGNEVCSGNVPYDATNTDRALVLTLTPKTATQLGLTGYAKNMFPYANQALVNDSSLGAAMVTDITNSAQAQAAYASFVPDVSGATRATAISLTDSASNVVAARQRELRMYATQEGDTTLWGQQFVQRLSQGNVDTLTGYNDSGFGFVVGVDEGDPIDGRYGGALTFFSGGMSQKAPTSAKTQSEYYLLTGYTDWRGKGLFIDTQLSVGYGNLKGKRYL